MKSCVRSLGTECVNSLIKATIWRIMATGISFLILFSFGLEYDKSILLALLDTCIKFFTFYLFDLCWNYIYEPIKQKICPKCDRSKENVDIEVYPDTETELDVEVELNHNPTPT